MLKCWRESPTQRPTFEELVKEFDALLVTLSDIERLLWTEGDLRSKTWFFSFNFSPFPSWLFRRERGRVVSASDSQSGGPGFDSRSGHLLDLCSVVPSSNSRPRL